ncbi:hypothetical protein HID58_015970 [Brassica napus]|uniref:Mei2-like C-terminal RNA recognition motif domain-containing protein n=1 Tax=Brassica napus TaxID=3708 RepID=A0ABQ8DLZ1_BRANA|nr:hypothetical protein HID58_015970 [Brassica napus]
MDLQHKNCLHFTLKILAKSSLHRPVENGVLAGEAAADTTVISWCGGGGSSIKLSPTAIHMLRNIPNKYTREMLIQFLDEYCEEESNKRKMKRLSKMNKGYAFVNFTKAEAVSKFKAA